MVTTLILGGARSGKSRRAQWLAEAASDGRIYLATAQARDDEMSARILRHRQDRATGWRTIEETVDLVSVLDREGRAGSVILVDCLTLWLSNLFEAGRDVDYETSLLCERLARAKGYVVLVSNEIGMGLVPETSLGRAFRDAQGRLNQAVAQAVDRVEFVAAGLPIRLKG
ncbi:MAG: bifunctional adenosylcobinamide kinase/adenosylcobinamide-phosphate guanylyltransferase [Burkholderiales bacterium]|nr:MAG: bifunctional adenosylcobinamide kinase/adenosylcobinamide-phosphate guanylyltransferase [Burkholderiales bacterium]